MLLKFIKLIYESFILILWRFMSDKRIKNDVYYINLNELEAINHFIYSSMAGFINFTNLIWFGGLIAHNFFVFMNFIKYFMSSINFEYFLWPRLWISEQSLFELDFNIIKSFDHGPILSFISGRDLLEMLTLLE